MITDFCVFRNTNTTRRERFCTLSQGHNDDDDDDDDDNDELTKILGFPSLSLIYFLFGHELVFTVFFIFHIHCREMIWSGSIGIGNGELGNCTDYGFFFFFFFFLFVSLLL